MSNKELLPAIELLDRRVDEAERKVNELLGALNLLRREAGLPPRSPGGGPGTDKPTSASVEVRSDTFFGKRQQTAVREYLEMRKTKGQDGPATPRQIYDALIKGGYQYDTKDEKTALVGLRAMLRKRTNVFIKVGDTNKYGLRSWYPEMRPNRDQSQTESENTQDTQEAAPAAPESSEEEDQNDAAIA